MSKTRLWIERLFSWYKGEVTHTVRRYPLILIIALCFASVWIETPSVSNIGWLLTGVLLGHFYW